MSQINNNSLIVAQGEFSPTVRNLAPGVRDVSPIGGDLEVRCYPVERVHFEALPSKVFFRATKRVGDFLFSLLALIVLAIPSVVIAILIKLDSEGPVLFRQERIGMGGRPFMLVKFRSMRVDAEAGGAQWASANDERVTRVGHFLRRSRLDEIPQFINVLRGEMSLIGPRPERLVFYQEFERYIPGFSQRLYIRPGISGLAQVNGGYDLAPQEKIVYDIEYIKRRSALLDFLIVLKTLGVLFSHVGAR
ncbi:sugar transferase [Actinomycetaceae bacterium L2_0104]